MKTWKIAVVASILMVTAIALYIFRPIDHVKEWKDLKETESRESTQMHLKYYELKAKDPNLFTIGHHLRPGSWTKEMYDYEAKVDLCEKLSEMMVETYYNASESEQKEIDELKKKY